MRETCGVLVLHMDREQGKPRGPGWHSPWLHLAAGDVVSPVSSSSNLPCPGMKGSGCKICRAFLLAETFLGKGGMVWRVGILGK